MHKHIMKKSFLLTSIISLFMVSMLSTQSRDSVDIEQVIISATRAAKNDPVTVQNISAREINRIYVGQDPAFLLQQLSPSIISFSDAGSDIGNYTQFRLRGIDQSRINVTLDGVPLNDMLDQGVFFSNFSDFGNSVESIQVQRGVSASNVGVASYGGAVNFESARVFGEERGTELQLTTGSFGTLRTTAELRTGLLDNGIGGYVRASRTTTDGFKDNSGADSYSIFGSIGYKGNKDVLKLTGFMGKTQNDQSYLPVLLSDIEANPRTNYNHPNDTDDFEQELILLKYQRSISPEVSFDATAYYGGARGAFPFGLDDTTQLVFALNNDHYGFLSNLKIEKDNYTLTTGLQAYQFDRTNADFTAPNVTNPFDRSESDKREISAYAKLNYPIGDLSLFANVQARRVGIDLIPDEELGTGIDLDESWFFLNVLGGLNYQVANDQSAYLSIGRTGREPTRIDIFNGVLDEEFVTDIELGYRVNNRKWAANANLFFMSFTDEISNVGALQELSYFVIRQNVPSSSRNGFELQVRHQTTEDISWTLNAAYLSTNVSEFDNGTEIFRDVDQIFSPSLVIRPQIDFHLFDGIRALVSGRYVSDAFMELSNQESFELPAHTVLNTQLDFTVTKSLDITLQVNNITNERYFTDGAPVDFDFDGTVEGPGFRIQPPRHFYLIATLRL